MNKPETKSLGRLPHGIQPIDALAEALANVQPGDRIVYHRGPVGTAMGALKTAANALCDGGTCTLAQRPIGIDQNGERIWEYMAIKLRGRNPRAN